MDSSDFHHIKMEKANAKLRHSRLQKITAMFRLMELCIFLIIFSRFTTQLPVAFKLSGEYFRGLSVAAVSPRFVFILGNAIVILLFLKSGQYSAKDGDAIAAISNNITKLDLYEEYVKICEKNPSVRAEQRKLRSTCEVYRKNILVSGDKEGKVKRCQSDQNLKRVQPAGRELRRSVTGVRCRGREDCEEKSAVVSSYKEDEMSSEEFRRTVEAFIARQQRFLREEEEFSATVSFET